MSGFSRLALLALLSLTSLSVAAQASPTYRESYPTTAIADYVFACMAGNGQTREVLERCSCSIDAIADLIDYESYVDAETILRMRLVSGEKASLFRNVEAIKKRLDLYLNAQTTAELLCF